MKKIILISILIMICLSIGISAKEFAVSVKISDFNDAQSVIQTSDGGFVVAGSDYPVNPLGGNSDIFLTKFSSKGKEVWTKTLGDSDYNDYGKDVIETSDGGFVVTGYTHGFGVVNEKNNLLLVKFDSDGVEQWTKTLGGANYYDFGSDVVETNDGGFVVTGQTSSLVPSNNNDILLIKFDSNGNEVWTKTLGGTGNDFGSRVIQTSDGSFVVTGSYGSTNVEFTPQDVLLAKFDSNGNALWTKTLNTSTNYGNDYQDYGRDVVETSDGGFVVTGQTSSFISDRTDTFLLLVKFDSDGNEVWTKTLGGTGANSGNSVTQTSDGGLVVTGNIIYDSISIPGTGMGMNPSDTLLVKFDSNGNKIWAKVFNTKNKAYDSSINLSSVDEGHSIIETSDGGLVMAGYTGGIQYTEIFPGVGLPMPVSDILLAKFDSNGDTLGCEYINNADVIVNSHDVSEHDVGLSEQDHIISEQDQTASEQILSSTTTHILCECEQICQDEDGDSYGAVGTDITICLGQGYDCDDNDATQYHGTNKTTDFNLPWDNIGECQSEISQCDGVTGDYIVVQQKKTPQQETCDGLDNNCNAIVDDVDNDNDGVNDCTDDLCLETAYDVFIRLNPNYHVYDGQYLNMFTTNIKSAKKPVYAPSYSIVQTFGCSCTQILQSQPGYTIGQEKYGCSKGTMENWINQRGWSKTGDSQCHNQSCKSSDKQYQKQSDMNSGNDKQQSGDDKQKSGKDKQSRK